MRRLCSAPGQHMPVVLLLPLRTETESRHWGRTQAADSPRASRLDPISQAETTPATSPTSPGPSFQPPCPGTSWPVSPELPPPAMASGYWITELHLPVPVPSKQFIDAGAWPELQATLRISTSNLKQGLYSIIQARPAVQRAELCKLYSDVCLLILACSAVACSSTTRPERQRQGQAAGAGAVLRQHRLRPRRDLRQDHVAAHGYPGYREHAFKKD